MSPGSNPHCPPLPELREGQKHISRGLGTVSKHLQGFSLTPILSRKREAFVHQDHHCFSPILLGIIKGWRTQTREIYIKRWRYGCVRNVGRNIWTPAGFYVGLSQGLHSNSILNSLGCCAVWGCSWNLHDWPRCCRKGDKSGCLWWGGGCREWALLLQKFLPEVRMCAMWGLLTGCYMCLSVDVTKLRDMLLLNEARHCHGNTALCFQPDAKPLNYIFSGWKRLNCFWSPKQWDCGGTRCLTPNLQSFHKAQEVISRGDITGTLMNFVWGRVWE